MASDGSAAEAAIERLSDWVDEEAKRRARQPENTSKEGKKKTPPPSRGSTVRADSIRQVDIKDNFRVDSIRDVLKEQGTMGAGSIKKQSVQAFNRAENRKNSQVGPGYSDTTCLLPEKEGLEDKWVFNSQDGVADSVVSAALSGSFCAWASRQVDASTHHQKDGVFLICYSDTDRSYKRKSLQFLETESLIQSLDFAHSQYSPQDMAELAAVDFKGYVYVFHCRGGTNGKLTVAVKQRIQHREFLPCVSIWRRDPASPAWVVVGTNQPELLLYQLPPLDDEEGAGAPPSSSGQGARLLFCGAVELGAKPLDSEILAPVLQAGAARRHWGDLGCEFTAAACDEGGGLTLVDLPRAQLAPGYGGPTQVSFSARFQLAGMEPGDMLSVSSPDPEKKDPPLRLAVACADACVRVLEHSRLNLEPEGGGGGGGGARRRRFGCWGRGRREEEAAAAAAEDAEGRAANSWQPIAAFSVPGGAQVLSASLSASGKDVAVAHEGREVCVYRIDAGCLTHTYYAADRVRCVALGERHLLMGCFDKTATIVDIRRGLEQRWLVQKTQRQYGGVSAVALDPGGKRLALGTGSGEYWVYNLGDAFMDQLEVLYKKEAKARVHDLAFSGDGRYLAVGDYSGTVVVLVAKTGRPAVVDKDQGGAQNLLPAVARGKFVWGLAFSAPRSPLPAAAAEGGGEGYVLAAASWNGTGYLFWLAAEETVSGLPNRGRTSSMFAYTRGAAKAEREHGHHGLTAQLIGESKESGDGPDSSRAFDVSLSANGRYLAAAWRSGVVRLYDLEQDQPASGGLAAPINEFWDTDKVYCCAVSPDGAYTAFGGVAKAVRLHRSDRPGAGSALAAWEQGHNVQKLSFMDSRTFGAVARDGSCTVFDAEEQLAILKLGFAEPCAGLAFTAAGGLAVAWGGSVTVLGGAGNCSGVRDHPSFQLLRSELMQDAESLAVALAASGCLANAASPEGESLLHLVVKHGREDLFTLLLGQQGDGGDDNTARQQGGVPVGLLKAHDGRTALDEALSQRNRYMLDEMLAAIGDGRIVDTPQVFGSFLPSSQDDHNCFLEKLGRKFPDSLIRFFRGVRPERCEPSVLGEGAFSDVLRPIYLGLPIRSPVGFWAKFLAGQRSRQQRLEEDDYGRVAKSAVDGSEPGGDRRKSGRDAAALRANFAVEAYRLPLKNLCGVYWEGGGSWDPLEVVVNASRKLHNYSAFAEDTAINHLIEYKWGILHKQFRLQCFFFAAYLVCAIFASWGLMSTHDMSFLDTWEHGGTKGRASLILACVLAVWTLGYMWGELKQFKDEVQHQFHLTSNLFKTFFKAFKAHYLHDIWNSVDSIAFITQLITSIGILVKPTPYLPNLQEVAALSILCLFFKIFFFARGIRAWSTYVRMIQNVVGGMAYFITVNLVILCGFAFAFWIAYSTEDFSDDSSDEGSTQQPIFSGALGADSLSVIVDPTQQTIFSNPARSLLTVVLIVFGQYDEDLVRYLPRLRLGLAMFQLMILLVNIILVNLLIAIMTDSYAEVRETAQQQVVFERANLILELEEQKRKVFAYSTWVHLLRPVDRSADEGGGGLGGGGHGNAAGSRPEGVPGLGGGGGGGGVYGGGRGAAAQQAWLEDQLRRLQDGQAALGAELARRQQAGLLLGGGGAAGGPAPASPRTPPRTPRRGGTRGHRGSVYRRRGSVSIAPKGVGSPTKRGGERFGFFQ